MLSFFRRKSAEPSTPTFKTRIEDFWNWYAEVAARFYQAIEEKNASGVSSELSAKVDELIPGFAWVFGPGANGKGHSLTLSGEGNPHYQFLAEYWQNRAPSLDGWTFHASRQPSASLSGWRLEIDDNQFEPLEFWLVPYINRDNETIDITVWHPLFSKLEDRQCWTVLFLVLDEILGEFGSQNWIGEIKMSQARLTESMSIKELPGFISDVERETEWKKYPPTDTWSSYTMKERAPNFRRGDIIAGTSRHMALVNEFSRSEDQMEEPLRDTGAEYIFVRFNGAILPAGEQIDARGKIEDALAQRLLNAQSGFHLGGAIGTNYAYIDLLIFDGLSSLKIIEQVLREHSLSKGTSIEFFSHEKRDQRIVL